MNLDQLELKWKIFAFLLGFCALLLIVLWLFQTVFLDTFYEKIKVKEIRRNAAVIINNMENENIGEIIADISDNYNITISITDLSGRRLRVNLPESPPRIPPPDSRRRLEENAALITKARNNGGEIHEYITSAAGNRPRNNRDDNRTRDGRTMNRGSKNSCLTPLHVLLKINVY